MLTKRILMGIIIVLQLSGCISTSIKEIPAESIQNNILITDSLNREVKLPKYPERILITGLQTPMLINFFYLFPEAGGKLLAVENRVQTTKEFINILDNSIATKMILEKGAGAEQIAPLNPDLIIMKDIMRDTVGIKLEELEFSVVYLNFETIERIKKDISILGEILNSQKRANEIISQIEKETVKISRQVSGIGLKPTVLLLQYSAQGGENVFKVPPAHWLQTVMIEEAGGIPVWKDLNGSAGWNIITIDQIAAWNAEFIFLVDYSGDPREDVNNLIKNPVWNSLKATGLGQFIPFPKDHLSWDQPDPRWILGLSWLAEKLHPELKDIYDEEKTLSNFFMFYYGLPEKVINEKIISISIVD